MEARQINNLRAPSPLIRIHLPKIINYLVSPPFSCLQHLTFSRHESQHPNLFLNLFSRAMISTDINSAPPLALHHARKKLSCILKQQIPSILRQQRLFPLVPATQQRCTNMCLEGFRQRLQAYGASCVSLKCQKRLLQNLSFSKSHTLKGCSCSFVRAHFADP